MKTVYLAGPISGLSYGECVDWRAQAIDEVSIGTCMEFGWADSRKTPIICAMEPEGNPHDHPMITEAIGFRVKTMQEALNVAISILR